MGSRRRPYIWKSVIRGNTTLGLGSIYWEAIHLSAFERM